MVSYSWKVRAGASFSQFVNATFLGGHMNMTVSARADREQHTSAIWSVVRRIADWLYGEGHCRSSAREDLDFAHDIIRENAYKLRKP